MIINRKCKHLTLVRFVDKKNINKEIKEEPLKRIKDKYIEFKNSQISGNIWIIGVINIIINIICIVLIFPQSILNVIEGDVLLVLALISLFIILVFNFVFIFFPTKFPIKVIVTEEEIKKKTKIKKNQKRVNSFKPEVSSKFKIEDEQSKYFSEEDMELEIPVIPEAPKKQEKLTLDSSNLSNDVIERIKLAESPNTKVVLVNCERCKAIITVPIPKNFVTTSELPVVPISFIHKNLQNKDQHCLTIHLDHDFDIRRQRISDVVLSSD
ncbi:hypothetical protein LCGC14_0946470 [marine sediment metagenome]|uniref:Uncharacterized protein n=1 Tax=marine sediment metagenome TaxID=412755 RepID=A0A0F9NNA5_9ZZZZ